MKKYILISTTSQAAFNSALNEAIELGFTIVNNSFNITMVNPTSKYSGVLYSILVEQDSNNVDN